MRDGAVRNMVDGFFLTNPDRDFFVFVDSNPDDYLETFVCVTKALDVVLFDRVNTIGVIDAATLAHWFSETDEGQATVKRMIFGLDDQPRVGSEVQARGELVMMQTSPTSH